MNTTSIKDLRKAAIDRARILAGGTTALARITGVKPPTVCQWINGDRPVPKDKCLDIELAIGMTRDELRPDIDWERMAIRYAAKPTSKATEAA